MYNYLESFCASLDLILGPKDLTCSIYCYLINDLTIEYEIILEDIDFVGILGNNQITTIKKFVILFEKTRPC